MAVDLSVFDRIKTKADFDREAEAWQLKKLQAMQAATGQDPASVKLANEIARARSTGDTQRLNDLVMSAKLMDRGVMVDPSGNPYAMGGYGDAVGSIEGAKAMYKQEAQNASDYAWKPQIARDVAQNEANVKLGSAPAIERATKAATLDAEAEAGFNKKAKQANDAIGMLDQAEQMLPKANEGALETGWAKAKSFVGKSDESTQTDEQLRLLSGWLVANVPRMEGPQSNFDVQNYKTMAADLGNSMKPIGDRLAALQGLRNLQSKYADQGAVSMGGQEIPMLTVDDLNRDPMAASRNAIMERNAQGIENPYQTLPQPKGQPAAPKKGQVVNGYIFMGGNPADKANWKKK